MKRRTALTCLLFVAPLTKAAMAESLRPGPLLRGPIVGRHYSYVICDDITAPHSPPLTREMMDAAVDLVGRMKLRPVSIPGYIRPLYEELMKESTK